MASQPSKASLETLDGLHDIYSTMPSTTSRRGRSVVELPDLKDLEYIENLNGKPSWRSLFNFTTRQHVPQLLLTVIFTVLSSLLQPTGAVFYGKVFAVLTRFGSGTLNAHDTLQEIAKWCTALVILGIVSWFIEVGFLSLWMTFGELQAKSVREQMFTNMLGKDMDWYDMRQDGIGSLLVRIETQIREHQLSVSQPLGFCIYEISVSVVALGLGFYFTWELTLVILATLPILAVILFFVSKHLAPAIEAQKRDLSLASKHTNAAISNINTVKAYNGKDHETWQYYTTIKRTAASYFLQARANALQFGFIKCATVGLFVQGFWFGLVLVNRGVDPARVYTTYYACLIAMQSIEIVLPQWLVLAKGKSAGHTLKAMMQGLQHNRGRKILMMRGSVVPDTCHGDIEIKNVSFSYPSNLEQNAMTGVNFFFPANETTYVVGRSGSGKSTIGNLLLKYYEIDKGEICIDGHSIQTLSLDWLRENITLVQQQSVLFNETILQNIAFGRKGPASREEILEAVDTADLQQMLDELPEGLDTVIGSSGKSLSGGQQQRVALARARLRDSPIVILDEATSALDQKSRAKITENIRKWRQGKTTIIITHDVSRILDEEYVYVLEHGAIVQEGYCRSLSEKMDGTFASFLPTDLTISSSSLGKDHTPLSLINVDGELPDSNELDTYGGFVSRLLGQKETGSNSWRHSLVLRDRPISMNMGSVWDHAVQALEYWTTPETAQQDTFTDFRQSPKRRIVIATPDPTSYSPTQFTTPSNIPSTSFLSPNPGPRNLREDSQPSIPFPFANQESEEPRTVDAQRPVTPLLPEIRENATLNQLPSARLKTIHSNNSSSHRALSTESNRSRSQFRRLSWSSEVQMTPESGSQPKIAIRPTQDTHPNPQRCVGTKSQVNLEVEGLHNRKAASMSQIIQTIWPMLNKKDRSILLLGFLASFIVAAATPAFAYVLAQLLSVYYLPSNRSAVAKKWALILIGITIVDGVATFCSHLALEYAAQQWVNGLRVEALKRILVQPRSWFDKDRNSPDRLSECLDRNAEEMRNLVGRFMGPIFISTWLMGISVVWALIISYKLTLVAISGFPVVYLSTRIYDWVTNKWEDRCNQVASTASNIFTETFSNIRVVRALTLEGHFQKKHDDAVQKAWKTGIRRGLYTGIMFGVIDSLSFFIVATIFRYAAVASTSGELSLLNMVQVINLLLFGISNAVSLLNIVPQINSSRTTGTQMLYLAQLPTYGSHETSGTKRIPTPFPVVFKDLSFTYPNRSEGLTLENINFKIEAGSCTAIVGASGSGKSTIASLLLGLYPPDLVPVNASIAPLTFSGVSIAELNLSSLRNFICIVAQQPLLFPTTIYENITYGLAECSPYLSLPTAVLAAKDAGIHEFIQSLPNGYNTLIGEGGMGISGGQAQRIVIARALIRRPKILILDEATSALDAVSAEAIKSSIKRIMEKDRLQYAKEHRTAVVIISHDVEMMKVADRLVVLERGRVVEEGGLVELSERGKAFRALIGRDIVEEVEHGGEGLGLQKPTISRSNGSLVQMKQASALRKGSI